MPEVTAGKQTYAVQGVVLDKDGTLIDLHHAWGPRTVRWIETLAREVNGPPEMAQMVYRFFGFDAESGLAQPEGPFISANETKLVTLAASALYQFGIPWGRAEETALQTMHQVYGEPLTADEIVPLGDVAGTVFRLRQAGMRVAIATADSRYTTEQSLDLLGIAADLDLVMCGDDPLPQKPDPGVLGWIAAAFGCQPAELLMVGDTVTDMLTGRNGRAAGNVAIVPDGYGASAELLETSDVVLGSIAELAVAP